MIRKTQFILLAGVLLGLSVPGLAQSQEAIPQVLENAISNAKRLHQDDYTQLKSLPDLSPENYLQARVQKPTAGRALKRLNLDEGVLIEAALHPTFDLIVAQKFPETMSLEQQAYWKSQSLLALQLGAVSALAKQGTELAENLLAYALGAKAYRHIQPTLCVLYGQVARHSEALLTLRKIAHSSSDPLVQQSAIIGMGKMRLLEAFHVLVDLETTQSAAHLRPALLHAYGHLANRAAQKAKPMADDAALHAKVLDRLFTKLNQKQEQGVEQAALASLSIVLEASDLGTAQSRSIHPQSAQAVQKLFSRIRLRAKR